MTITTMETNEQLLLLELLLRDLRGNWGSNVSERTTMALALSNELELEKTSRNIKWFAEAIEADEQDGRAFRTSYNLGGYEGMESTHGLDYKINPRSQAFQEIALEILANPESRFEDWEDFEYPDWY